MGKAEKEKLGIPFSWSVPAFLFLDPFLAGVMALCIQIANTINHPG